MRPIAYCRPYSSNARLRLVTNGKELMNAYKGEQLSSALIHTLDQQPQGVAAAELIDALIREGFAVEQVVRTVRQMLDSGEVGLSSEMHICRHKQLA